MQGKSSSAQGAFLARDLQDEQVENRESALTEMEDRLRLQRPNLQIRPVSNMSAVRNSTNTFCGDMI